MKLSLVVLTPGAMQGKSIPINLNQFVIGRDPACHLRPASPLVSKRHCALLVRDGSVLVEDFGSTNGTAVNNQPVKGQAPIKNEDVLKIGPLEFKVMLEMSAPVNLPTPLPRSAATVAEDHDDAAAAMLLSLQDDTQPSTDALKFDGDGVPTGSTIMEVLPGIGDAARSTDEPKSGGAAREKAAKMAQGNTSTAAKAILEKYMRRPRG